MMDWDLSVIFVLAISDSLDYARDRSTWVNHLRMMEWDLLHNNRSNLPDKTYTVTHREVVQKMAWTPHAVLLQLNESISTRSVPKIWYPYPYSKYRKFNSFEDVAICPHPPLEL